MWYEICKQLPEVQFLAFTKSFMLDFNSRPENLAIIWSVFPSTEPSSIPPGPRAYTDFSCLGLSYPRSCNGGDDENYNRFRMAMQCTGNCERCGFCFNIEQNSSRMHLSGGPEFLDVGFHAHGRAVTAAAKKYAAQQRGDKNVS